MTVDEIIQQARETHPAFTPESTPNSVLIRYLSRLHRDLVGRILRVAADVLVQDHEIALPLADFAAGAAVPDHQFIRGGSVYVGATERPLYLIRWQSRIRPVVWPAAWLEGNTLHLVGDAAQWAAADRIVLKIVPTPADLVAMTDVVALPDIAESTCVTALAAFLAQRTADVPPLPQIPRQRLQELARETEERLFDRLAGRSAAIVSFVEEVW